MEKKIRGGGSSKSSSARQSAKSLGGRTKARNRLAVRKVKAPLPLNGEKKARKEPLHQAPTLLIANRVRKSLEGLEGWQVTDDHKKIYREFILRNFMDAVGMIDRIAVIAEGQKHHPDVHLTQYRNLRIGLTTHEVGGLSENDLAMASKINELPRT